MGKPMARHLLKAGAFAVTIFGRNPAVLEELALEGAQIASSPADLAARSELIVVMLPDLPQLEAAWAEPTGLRAGIHSPTTVVICSTTSPTGVRELGSRWAAETHGLVRVVDAPVSGGVEGAAAASLSIMVGAEEDDYQHVAGVLGLLGTPTRLGPLGSGQVAKACNQLVVAATITALAEATVIAERSGIAPAALLGVLSGGYADSRLLRTRMDRLINKDYTRAGPARFILKDLGFAAAEAADGGTNPILTQVLLDAFEQLVSAGLGDYDMSVIQSFIAERVSTGA